MSPGPIQAGAATKVVIVDPTTQKIVAGASLPVVAIANYDPAIVTGLFRAAGAEIGDIAGGNYAEIESDGTLEYHGDARVWDDGQAQLFAQKIDVASGRIDYNYTECTVDFADNARYPEEVACMAIQMFHTYNRGTTIYPHLHWFQNQNELPNWLLEYRVCQNGVAPSGWTLRARVEERYAYTAGTILQISTFGTIAGVNDLSFSIDLKLYRDSGNVSTLFAGADPYIGDAAAKFADVHYQVNTDGSRTEWVK